MVKGFPTAKLNGGPKAAYRRLRPDIKTGDLFLCAGTFTFSNLIQRATRSPWSHVALIVRLEHIDRVMIMESVEPQGVRTVPLSKYLNDYEDGKAYAGGIAIARRTDFPAMDDAALVRKFGQRAVDMFGYPYDLDQILKLAMRVAGSSLMGRPRRRTFDKDREFICSEYVELCYRAVGIKVAAGKHGFVAPSDFVRDKNKIDWIRTIKNPDK